MKPHKITIIILILSSVLRATALEKPKVKITQIAQWEVIDLTFKARIKTENPFTTDFGALFIHEKGDTLRLPGFYNGGESWVVRFSSTITGKWSYLTYGPEGLSGHSAKIMVVNNSDENKHGAITIPENDPCHFYYEDETPYFLLAFECDWLFALDYYNDADLPKSRHLLSLLEDSGINQIVMNVFSYDVSWQKDSLLLMYPEHEFGGSEDIFPFLGNNENPDFSSLNVTFFKKLDRTISLMAEYNIDSHLMIYVWNKLVNWPDMYSEADNMYFDYVVKRYQAYTNIIFDISKEALFYGRADEAYILERIERVRKLDQYHRLLSVHDFGFCKRNPDKVDFISTQNWRWDIYNVMLDASQEFKDKPLFNIEHGGYEESPYTVFTGAYTDPAICLQRNYHCLFAGAYSTYYWQAAAWNVIIHNPFEQSDSFIKPKFSYYKHLVDFFTVHPYAQYKPAPWRNGSAFALVDLHNDKNFLFYVHKENYCLPSYWLNNENNGITFQWFNTLTGIYSEVMEYKKTSGLISPWMGEADAILILKSE